MDILDCVDTIDRYGFLYGMSILGFDSQKKTYRVCWWKALYCFMFSLSISASFYLILSYENILSQPQTILNITRIISTYVWATVPLFNFVAMLLHHKKAILAFSHILRFSSSISLQPIKWQQNFLLLLSLVYYGPFLVAIYLSCSGLSFLSEVLPTFAYHATSINVLWTCSYQKTLLNVLELHLVEITHCLEQKLFLRPQKFNEFSAKFNEILKISKKFCKFFQRFYFFTLPFSVSVSVNLLFYAQFAPSGWVWSGWFTFYIFAFDSPILVAIYYVVHRVGRLWVLVSSFLVYYLVLYWFISSLRLFLSLCNISQFFRLANNLI